MKRIDFCKDWYCTCLTRDEGSWPVTLPHDAMISEPRTLQSRGEGNIGWFIGGDYAYTKRFHAPRDWEDREVILEFEAVYHNAEVWINGTKAAFRPYGYINFCVDTGGYLKYGAENELRVIARNSDQPNSRWYSGTGMFRPVNLYIGEKKHIPVNGLRIRTVGIDPAVIEVQVRTSHPGAVCIEILDDDRVIAACTGMSDGKLTTVLPLENVTLWDVDTPKLYTCRATYENDVAEDTFGIRLIQWDPETGFAINGKRVILRGACIHHDNGLLGACAHPEAEARRVRRLKENGYNAIRSAHNPCSKALLDACDRLGMLVMDEYADVWYIHKTEYDYASCLGDWWRQDLQDMVDKDYNHPSVIMYSTGNEVSETAQKRGIELTGQMTEYLHSLDGTRPVTCGINIFFNFLSSIGFGVYTDKKARKNAQASLRSENQKRKKPVGSAFYNMLAAKLGDHTMKLGATLPPCDWKTRDAYANMDIAGYNYGLYRYPGDLKKYPNRLILGTETFCKDAFSFWEMAKKNKRILGDFVWPGISYLGEVSHPTEYSDYTMENPAAKLCNSSTRIDITGKPGVETDYTKVAFELETGPYIAVTPVYQKEKLRFSGWQLSRGLASWSWRGCEGMPAQVEVYARAAQVVLLLNGKEVARKRVSGKNCRTLFRIPYDNGTLTAVSYDRSGQEIAQCSLTTAAEDTQLHLLPEKAAAKPGELVFVRLQYADEKGIWKPMEKHHVSVHVENGELLAVGSACPYREGKLTGDSTGTYFAEALAVLRAGEPGTVRVSAVDERETCEISIPCEA